MDLSKRILPALLAISIIIFSFLRIYNLTKFPVSLFSDEVDIGYQVKSFLTNGKDYQGNFLPLQFHSFSDVRTALPIYSTALFSLIPGVGIDQAIRLTPAIFSLLGIYAIFLLTNELFDIFGLRDKKVSVSPGLLAAFLLALSPWHFTYSRTGFELSQLFAFFSFGLYFFARFVKEKKNRDLYVSLVLLALIPMVYSTAKLSLCFIPFVLLAFPEFRKKIFRSRKLQVFTILLFIPLVAVILNGGAAKRFKELAIYTDPTLSATVNFLRQQDLGQNLILGSKPSPLSVIIHNKPLIIITAFINNLLKPISPDFLFVAGDMNPRQAVQGWGMLLKTEAIFLGLGAFLLISRRKYPFLIILGVLIVMSIAPAALTRDGGTHASRNFMLLLPITLTSAYGLYSLWKVRLVPFLLVAIMLFESLLYTHNYFTHYPYDSQRDFHAGLKELVSEANKYPGQTIVLTRTYEPSLIFFLYYTNFPPTVAQNLIPKGKLTQAADGSLNLEGVKIDGTNVYLASVHDYTANDPLVMKDAIYVLPYRNAADLVGKHFATKIDDISLPSGEPYVTVIKPIAPAVTKK